MTKHDRQLMAGVAKVEITCKEGGVWNDLLSAEVKKHIPPEYLRMPVRVADPLFVRVLVLDDGSKQLVLVVMDVTAIGCRTTTQNILFDSADDFVPRLRERVERELGLPGDHITVSASHTHHVPRMLCEDDEQIERTLAAIRQAKDNMVPVQVGVGSGMAHGLTLNRTIMMKDGTDRSLRHTPPPSDDEVEGIRPVDPEIGVLRIDRLDGSPFAVVYNFGVHLSLGGPDGQFGVITGDHIGVTLRYLEEQLGGAMAMFTQGALGDVVEVLRYEFEVPRMARTFGINVGQLVARIHAGIRTGPATIGVVRKQAALPLRKDIPEVVARLRQEQMRLVESLQYTSLNFKTFLPLYLKYSLNPEYPSHSAFRYLHDEATGDMARKILDERSRNGIKRYLESIRTMERLVHYQEDISTLQKHQEIIQTLGGEEVPAEYIGIRIGDCVMITAPFEILTEIGLNVKKSSPFRHTFVVSLSNGYYHYAPPASYYPRGGYEVTECMLAPEWEQRFDNVVKEIVEDLQKE